MYKLFSNVQKESNQQESMYCLLFHIYTFSFIKMSAICVAVATQFILDGKVSIHLALISHWLPNSLSVVVGRYLRQAPSKLHYFFNMFWVSLLVIQIWLLTTLQKSFFLPQNVEMCQMDYSRFASLLILGISSCYETVAVILDTCRWS